LPVAPASVASGYRPWLDGLRAVAVVLVLLQHGIGEVRANLGGVGVGLFFALSGYLITSLLLDEWARTGTVSLPRFYLRRAARLAPALIAVVLICDLAFLAEGQLGSVKASGASLFYLANYTEIAWHGYLPGFGHTWSLSVVEHFYLVWPVVLLWVLHRWGPRPALSTTLAICAADLLWRGGLALLHAPTILLDVGSIERADALLYGCAASLAVRLGWRPRSWVPWTGLVALSLVVLWGRGDSYGVLVLGDAVLAASAAALVVGLDYAGGVARLRTLLSLRAVVLIGVLSYGIYLWHVPLIGILSGAGLDGLGWRTLGILLALPIAWISHRFLESPVRAAVRRRENALAGSRFWRSVRRRPLSDGSPA
jgi:peptidoglycan/LPS O-acetylase OafA/YrhL